MGRLNFKPSRVYATATQMLETKSTTQIPPWYLTVGSIPPAEILTRTQPVQHTETSSRKRTKKASKLFSPQLIEYEEDRFRAKFYSDHPWELARPRVILEQDGKDREKCDWSKMRQSHHPLNGESVVQRQWWLLKNVKGMTSTEAYGIARREFYELRHEEEVERRIAKEEAQSTGAYFGKSRIEIGMELEDKVYESWKEWAIQESSEQERTRSSAYTGFGADDESEPEPQEHAENK